MGTENVMIQAEIGGGAKVDPGHDVQRPGYMVRDFALRSSSGEEVRISSFHGSANLVLVFPGQSDAMHAFVHEAARHDTEFSEQETIVVTVLPYDREQHSIPASDGSSSLVLYDESLTAYHLSGATDGTGCLVPVVYVTDHFGEIVSAYVVPDHALPPRIEGILRILEFINHQCPECEPPEWPR